MIEINCADIDTLAEEYKAHLFGWLHYKKGKKDRIGAKVGNGKSRYRRMLKFVYERLDKLVLCKKSEDFAAYIGEFITEMRLPDNYFIGKDYKKDKAFQEFKTTMGSYYKGFFYALYPPEPGITYGHWLAARLGVKVCPYCNRTYTFTISEDDVLTRPQFDHFKPKSVYPFFAVSFYNLIPSCPVCNMIKAEKEMDINPHLCGLNNEEVFRISCDGEDEPVEWITNKDKIRVKVNHPSTNFRLLGTEKLYNGHIDYIEEIVDKMQAYNLDYYEGLITGFQGLAKQPEEIDRFIWGCYLDTALHGNRPMSKLTYDILKQLKIIE